MKKLLYSFMMLAMALGMSVAFTACGDDEPAGGDKNPNNPSGASAIVGEWNTESEDYYMVVDIKTGGTLTYVEYNLKSTSEKTWKKTGSGTWAYNERAANWTLRVPGTAYNWTGDYLMLDGKLTKTGTTNIVFDKGSKDEPIFQEPEEDYVPKLVGATWVGYFETKTDTSVPKGSDVSLEIRFSNDGEFLLTEYVTDEDDDEIVTETSGVYSISGNTIIFDYLKNDVPVFSEALGNVLNITTLTATKLTLKEEKWGYSVSFSKQK
ncbi:MAG: hypothetical protein J1F07_07275 [Muribaculaceae bacterium]|nr:hypothetical protein [Muribaculaceae bacterium]